MDGVSLNLCSMIAFMVAAQAYFIKDCLSRIRGVRATLQLFKRIRKKEGFK